MSKVALIIIYNHQYNKNIEILEEIYKGKFSNIYHLVPFYNGDKKNVIAVYDNSYYFEGYVAQGFKSFFKEEFQHYFFVADDLVLNPLINETNYATHLKLGTESCFIPRLVTLHEVKSGWPRVGEAYHYNMNLKGVEVKGQLPSYEEALEKFSKFGLSVRPLKFSQIWKTPASFQDVGKKFLRDKWYGFRFLANFFSRKKYKLPYPMVAGYSDIFVISSGAIKQFCHYCGVFAATRLFVEVAIPTAMVLTANDIVVEETLGLQGKALWTDKDFELLEKYKGDLTRLIEDFPKGHLFLHPVKLSKWKMK